MDHFTELLEINRISIERFVRFRLSTKEDADDVLQEIYLAAYQKFGQLKKKTLLKPGFSKLPETNARIIFAERPLNLKFRWSP